MKIAFVSALTIAAATLLVACGGQPSAPSTVTVTQPAPGSGRSSSAAAAGPITIPDLTNENAEIARSKLSDLGLTNVELSSANPKYSVVILASNWTVVSIDPAPGTVVKTDDTVVVKVTKP
jgi:PASTA domain